MAEADSFFPLHKYLHNLKWDLLLFFLIFAHLSSVDTSDLTKSAHISESDSWEKTWK